MKDLSERLRAAGVHTLLAQFTDIHGTAKGQLVPFAHLDDLLTDGAGFYGASVVGSGLPRTGPRAELFARGNASTITPLPWMPGVARVVCDGFVDGQPFEACPRQVLRLALGRLAARGWHLRTGIEPEFFLLRRDGDRFRPADDTDRLDMPSYDIKSLARQSDFLDTLHGSLARCGLDVLLIDHEDAQSQYELQFAFDEALASADHLMLFKLAGHALAEARGMVFSMMPKPSSDQPGSGMHFHVSLWQGDDENGRCLFVPHRPDNSIDTTRELSDLGRWFVGGMLAHAAALTAIAAPTVNSYKRLMIGQRQSGSNWAPTHVAQGPNNRTALVRTLHGRFEWRLPDASCNPYLVSAALVAAGLDGIDRKLDPGPDCVDDLFELSPAQLAERGIGLLPQDLGSALRALEADAVIRGALGETLTSQFIRLKRVEWDEYVRHVSDWELQRYAAAF